MKTVCKADTQTVKAKPFVHQVGGRTSMLVITPETICKLYTKREVQFYENIPEILKAFTPQYKGLVTVKCSKEEDKLTFYAEVPGYILWNKDHQNNIDDCDALKLGLDNWSRTCEKGYRDFWADSTDHNYIMLENLVGSLRMPCILDLKLGTKQTGDDTSEKDRKLREFRSAHSTSGSLGIRLTGMHMYQSESNTYLSHNKFYGWTLDDSGLRQVLRQFFNRSHMLNVHLVARMISKLRRLRLVLSTQDKFYFFGSSLLLFYDGYIDTALHLDHSKSAHRCSDRMSKQSEHLYEHAPRDQKDGGKREAFEMEAILQSQCDAADARLIDFGRAVQKSEMKERSLGVEFEEGLLFGLDNLICILQSMVCI
ncbi:inositol hexakisphosphate kinase 1-like [Ylistrum balloti]|uniref:inositol hexakisphosphate kinase 1-like n=1 Tax=Ylistrum balloti TaxID=509963 RepID=UPI002905CEFD|nr:inositol hexakisphosphate kinase 1-like [Ylistrum balloti]